MPIELVAAGPISAARPAGGRRIPLVFAAQLAAILADAGLSIALASLPSASIVGSAQVVVAGP